MIPRIVQLLFAVMALAVISAGKECPVIAIPARSPTPAPDNTTDELVGVSSSTPAPVLSCPGIDDPANFTECCYEYDDDQEDQEDGEGSADGGSGAFLDAVKKVTDDDDDGPKVRKPRCCAPKIEQSFLDWLLGLDDRICRVAMIVALSVTGTLLLFTIIFIVCCFWSKCPLYYTCRVKYDKDDIIATAGDEETANLTDMPAEEKGVKGYSPNEVKVTTLNEEEEPCLKKEKEADEQQPLVEKKEEKKKDEKKKEDKKKEEKKKEDKKKEEKKKEEKKKEEKKKEEKKKEEKKKDDKKKDDKKEEEAADNKEDKKKEEDVEKKEEKKEEEKKGEESKEEK